VKWCHFWVTSRHLSSCDVISCHVTPFSCELQPCRIWNVHYTRVFGFPQPLPGNFWSNDVTSGSLPVIWGHVTSFPVPWLPPASYSLVGSETYSIRKFSAFHSHFQVTSSQMTSLPGHIRSPEARDISCDMTASYCELQPCTKWSVQYSQFLAFHNRFQVTSGQMTSLTGPFRSPESTWRHFISCGCLRLRCTTL